MDDELDPQIQTLLTSAKRWCVDNEITMAQLATELTDGSGELLFSPTSARKRLSDVLRGRWSSRPLADALARRTGRAIPLCTCCGRVPCKCLSAEEGHE